MERSVISVYCDMSLMLTYKAAYQTAVMVSQQMNSKMTVQLAGKYTHREEQIQLEAAGIPAGLIRVSCGLEDSADLIADIAQALK